MSFPLSICSSSTNNQSLVRLSTPCMDPVDKLAAIKAKLKNQIETLSQIDLDKASSLSHRVSCCQWTALEVESLRRLGLQIDEDFRPQGLFGGLMGAELIIIPAILKMLASAMSNGNLFQSDDGKKNAENVRCKMTVNGKLVEGTYTGQMAKQKKNFLMSSWVPYGDGKIVLQNGDYFEGRWKDGLFWNIGTYETADGSFCYEGHWQAGQRVGYGKLFESNSKGQRMLRYEGQWKDGLFHGNGTYYNEDNSMQSGKWNAGYLEKSLQTQEDREILVKNIIGLQIEKILPDFKTPKVDKKFTDILVKTQGLERNNWMAETMKAAGLREKENLPLDQNAPQLQVMSHNTTKLLPLFRATQLQTIDLNNVTLPSQLIGELEHNNALEWLKSHVSSYEKLKSKEPSSIKSLETLTVKRLILAVGVPVDSAKGYKGEFSPGLVRHAGNKETWGFIAWTNNGVQWASGAEYGSGGSTYKIMTEEEEGKVVMRRGWAIQSIDASHMSGLQAATLRSAIEKNLGNAIHIIAFRYIEESISASSRQNSGKAECAPEVGTMVRGEHEEKDERGVYKAEVYRRFDPKSIVMTTLIASPVNIRKGQLTENELKLSIQSHQAVLQELVEHSLLNTAI